MIIFFIPWASPYYVSLTKIFISLILLILIWTISPDKYLCSPIRHLAVFISGLWQIHAFGEGNTRTTAVFFIKYLRTLGYDVTNDIFAKHSWYFRNALVRANYTDLKNDIHSTTEYLELFLENLLLNKHHKLLNRTMHIANTLKAKSDIQISKSDIETLCKERINNITNKSIQHILKLHNIFGNTQYFGHSDIKKTLGIKASAASSFIKMLLDNKIINPIQGKGKGKYIFAI